MAKPTRIQKDVVWNRWFGGEVRALYYADLAGSYRRRQTVITYSSLATSSGALVTVVFTLASSHWPWLPAVVALLPTGLSLYALAERLSEKAAEATELQLRWQAFYQENRRLWDDMHADMASRRMEELDVVERELDALGNRLPDEEERLNKWQAIVTQQHELPISDAA